MATPVVHPRPQMGAGSPEEFCSSPKLNTLQHAKSLRNSVIIRDPSANSIQSIRINTLDNPEEHTTGLIKMTSSPSLSALAGILNEKTKKADIMARKLSTNLIAESIEEDDEESNNISTAVPLAEQADLQSPNLIDLNDNDEATVFKHPINLETSVEQPDFLTTPVVNQNPIYEDPPEYTTEIAPKENVSLPDTSAAAEADTTLTSMTAETAHTDTISFEGRSENDDKDDLPVIENCESPNVSDAEDVPDLVVKKNVPPEEKASSSKEVSRPEANHNKKRRRSLLNFWKKPKSSTEKQSSEKRLSSSKSFSISNQAEPTGDIEIGTKPINKRSQSSSSIFSSFRRNRQSSASKKTETTANEARVIPKSSQEHAELKPVSKRKATPLDFNKALPEIGKESKFSRDLFPKSLNLSEVESIVSIEMSRSIVSNQRNSISSLRTKSLSDHISLNAKMEGMFVTEAINTSLAAPDLSKSPTNSILRNGRFESTIDDDSPNDSTYEANKTLSSRHLSPEHRDSSFGSIEQKLNELTMDSDKESVTQEMKSTTIQQETPNIDNDDSELISEIMEFTSIIDFGLGMELDFDLNEEESASYGTLNPAERTPQHSLPDAAAPEFHLEEPVPFVEESVIDAISEKNRLNATTSKPLDSTNSTRDSTPENLSSRNYTTFSDNSFNFEHYDDEEEFENEDFNKIEINTESPRMNAFLPDMATSMSRPLSMSFRGLKAPHFNSNMDIPSMSEYAQDYASLNSDERSRSTKFVKFSTQIVLYDTYGDSEYDRHPDSGTCNQLTPQLAQMIKEELNELKAEMDIHDESKCYTHFY